MPESTNDTRKYFTLLIVEKYEALIGMQLEV